LKWFGRAKLVPGTNFRFTPISDFRFTPISGLRGCLDRLAAPGCQGDAFDPG
jgi:hypothetical protein